MGPPILVDLPGHGRHAGETDPARFTLDAVERDLFALTEADPVDLVGYSMGGRLALAFTVRHPRRVRRLVLESASPGLATDPERARRRHEDEALAAWIEDNGIEAFVDRWQALPLFESQGALEPRVREAQRGRRLLNHAASLAASLRGLGTGALPSCWGSLGALRVPVLFVAGAHDTKFVDIARRMAAALPTARLAVVDGAGHAVHLERPGIWVEIVTDFLTEGRDAV